MLDPPNRLPPSVVARPVERDAARLAGAFLSGCRLLAGRGTRPITASATSPAVGALQLEAEP